MRVLEMAAEEAEDAEEERQERQPVDLRVFKDRQNPLEEYSDNKFVRRYRLSKETFRYLLDLIGPAIEHPTRRNHALLPVEQLGIALRFYAFGSFQMEFGDASDVSQSSASRVVRRVSEAICNRKEHFIRFPLREEERRTVIQGFNDIANFPGVIGAIDGTHVAIGCPGGMNADYSGFVFAVSLVPDLECPIV